MGSSGMCCELAGYRRTNRTARPLRGSTEDKRPGSLRRPVRRKLPKGGGRVYIAAQSWEPNRTELGMRAANMSAVHQNGNPGEMILVRANRSNFGRPEGRRYNLAQARRKRLAACGVVLFASAMCASFGGAQDRAVAYAPADIRYGAQI